jgi:hypothetical protein
MNTELRQSETEIKETWVRPELTRLEVRRTMGKGSMQVDTVTGAMDADQTN